MGPRPPRKIYCPDFLAVCEIMGIPKLGLAFGDFKLAKSASFVPEGSFQKAGLVLFVGCLSAASPRGVILVGVGLPGSGRMLSSLGLVLSRLNRRIGSRGTGTTC